MGKVIITISDVEGKPDKVNVNVEFDPPLDREKMGSDFKATPAQCYAMRLLSGVKGDDE